MMRGMLVAGLVCLVAISAEETAVVETVLWNQGFVLKVSEDQGKAIEEIITTLGTNSVISLGFKKGHLKALGKQLKGVGSLNFLGYIFSKENLKGHMKVIQKSSFKWNGFMDGIKPGLDTESQTGKLEKDLPGFAALVGADSEKLVVEMKKRDWDSFVGCLIDANKS